MLEPPRVRRRDHNLCLGGGNELNWIQRNALFDQTLDQVQERRLEDMDSGHSAFF